MSHLIVTRFAVPRPEPETLGWYRDREWLEERMRLFRTYYVPSVEQTGVPAVLLCGSEVVPWVAEHTADLSWVSVEAQDDWQGGWTAENTNTITRLDSDDALRGDWFEAVDRAPGTASICVVKEQLRWEPRTGRLHRLVRREPGPLAAFRGGRNPYARDHRHLDEGGEVAVLAGAYLLQIVHGGNVKNRRLKAWRLDRRAKLESLRDYGLSSTSNH